MLSRMIQRSAVNKQSNGHDLPIRGKSHVNLFQKGKEKRKKKEIPRKSNSDLIASSSSSSFPIRNG